MIFGVLNPEKIWHQQLVHLPTSPVYCSHQKSLKSVNSWQGYLENKKVDVFGDTVYVCSRDRLVRLICPSQQTKNSIYTNAKPNAMVTLTCEIQLLWNYFRGFTAAREYLPTCSMSPKWFWNNLGTLSAAEITLFRFQSFRRGYMWNKTLK